MECVHHLGANNVIRHFSKCMSPLAKILNNFDQKHNVPVSCVSYTTPSCSTDRDMIIQEIRDKTEIFKKSLEDFIRHFQNFYAIHSSN